MHSLYIILTFMSIVVLFLSSAAVKLCCCSFWLVSVKVDLREALWGGLRLFHRLWEERWTSVTLRWTRALVNIWRCFWNILKDWKNWISVTVNSLMTAWRRCCRICTKLRLWSELQRHGRNRETLYSNWWLFLLFYCFCLISSYSLSHNNVTDESAERIHSVVSTHSNIQTVRWVCDRCFITVGLLTFYKPTLFIIKTESF